MDGFFVSRDLAMLATSLAEMMVEHAAAVTAVEGRYAVALSGGSTPRVLYERLASPEYAGRIDWARVHVFWGDERCVPPDHADSNYRLARETLLDHVPIPAEQVYRMRGELDPAQAADVYHQTLHRFFAADWPRFDLVLLGLGEDGHTASLFPGTAALHETTRAVVANYVEKLAAWRITLTLPAINAARFVAFMVAGTNKTKAFHAVLFDKQEPALPAQLIRPAPSCLGWWVDRAAALGAAIPPG